MSAITTAKKRKSLDSNASVAKKVKMAKSADKPAPLKSSLKTSKTTTTTQAVAANGVMKKKKTATKSLSAPAEYAEEKEELTPDQTAALLAGFSSDSDNEAEDDDGVALSSIPKPPTPKTTISAPTDEDHLETTPAVLYIGRIPHGFYEPQMRAYFSQFGTITQLRLARNKKTGKSQHYAFIEFASSAVADIVRRTMDKYLLFGHILQVRAVPRESVRENMFAGSGRRARRKAPRNRMEGRMLEKGVSREAWTTRLEREQERRRKKSEALRELGYEFDMPALKGVEDVPLKVKDAEAGAEQDGDEGGVELVTSGADDEEAEGNGVVVTEEKVTKKSAASGKTEVRKKVKKVKA